MVLPLETLTRKEPEGLPTAPPWRIGNCWPAGPRVMEGTPDTIRSTGTVTDPPELFTVIELL